MEQIHIEPIRNNLSEKNFYFFLKKKPKEAFFLDFFSFWMNFPNLEKIEKHEKKIWNQYEMILYGKKSPKKHFFSEKTKRSIILDFSNFLIKCFFSIFSKFWKIQMEKHFLSIF